MDLIEIGYFSKTHGIKGHLIFKNEADFYKEELTALFVEINGSKAPYFISDLKESDKGFIILLEEINEIGKAKLLTGKKVFIEKKFIIEQDEETEWIGYELIDKNFGSLGNITGVSDNGVQLLISIIYKGKEIILPFAEEFIEKINKKAKKIRFNAPEGLIDVYLGT